VSAQPCGGSTSEHDYVMRSRSRDRTSSTREPRAFSSHFISLRATHYCIRTNGPPSSTSTCYTSLTHPSTASLLDDRICPPAQDPNTPPMTYLCPENVYSTRPNRPFGTWLWYPGHRLLVTCIGCMRLRMSPCLFSTLVVAF
jgi:hypothetical protein